LKYRNIRTILSFNTGITDRKDFFSLATFNTSWGYELNWKNKLLSVRLPNIEYSYLIRRDTLKKLIENNASYKYIFNNGLITSTSAKYIVSFSRANRTGQLRLNGEIAGFLLGYFESKFLENLMLNTGKRSRSGVSNLHGVLLRERVLQVQDLKKTVLTFIFPSSGSIMEVAPIA
jgi:hypothetical protein